MLTVMPPCGLTDHGVGSGHNLLQLDYFRFEADRHLKLTTDQTGFAWKPASSGSFDVDLPRKLPSLARDSPAMFENESNTPRFRSSSKVMRQRTPAIANAIGQCERPDNRFHNFSNLSIDRQKEFSIQERAGSRCLSSSVIQSNSSNRMTMQLQNPDMSIGEGGPPKVRFPSGGDCATKPLFVDCSVEYELPKIAKIPSDSQPLLMRVQKLPPEKKNIPSFNCQASENLKRGRKRQFNEFQMLQNYSPKMDSKLGVVPTSVEEMTGTSQLKLSDAKRIRLSTQQNWELNSSSQFFRPQESFYPGGFNVTSQQNFSLFLHPCGSQCPPPLPAPPILPSGQASYWSSLMGGGPQMSSIQTERVLRNRVLYPTHSNPWMAQQQHSMFLHQQRQHWLLQQRLEAQRQLNLQQQRQRVASICHCSKCRHAASKFVQPATTTVRYNSV